MFKYIFILISILLLASCGSKQTRVMIQTQLGNITLELHDNKAPVTVAEFINNIKKDIYKNSLFYRTVTKDNQPNDSIKIEVIQGGVFDDSKLGKGIKHESTKETGILHQDGVISMARDTVGSASTEFFICIGKQPELDFGGKRNKDGNGFAAFGMVISGMDVVKKIHESFCKGQLLDPPIRIKNISVVN